MNTIKYALIICTLLAINGCTSTTIIPQTGGINIAIHNGPTQREAEKFAYDKATRICLLQDKQVKAIDFETNYIGDDKDQQLLVDLSKKVLPPNKTMYKPENFKYKAILTFKCE